MSDRRFAFWPIKRNNPVSTPMDEQAFRSRINRLSKEIAHLKRAVREIQEQLAQAKSEK